MLHPDRHSTLTSMINLRRLPMFKPGSSDLEPYQEAWDAKHEAPEQRVLEIAELAYVLEADGFPETEIFRRIGFVYPPCIELTRLGLRGYALRDYVVHHLTEHAPKYLELGANLLNSALRLAELWAMPAAERQRDARWPPEELLEPSGFTPCFLEKQEALDIIDAQSHGASAIAILDQLVEKRPFPKGFGLRRMSARAVPGDELRNYSTGEQSFQFSMGAAGYALVRQGRAIDFVEIVRN